MRSIFSFALIVFVMSIIWLSTSLAQDDSRRFERDILIVPISMYILVDDIEQPDPELSSQRTVTEVLTILEGMNEIWSQADIQFEANFVGTLEMSTHYLQQVQAGSMETLFDVIAEENISVPQPGMINGFYAKDIGGVNGIVPFGIGTPIFFVTDEPSVFDRRVSSHEVGHIFQLHHTIDDPNRLLFPGTNGMQLSEEEITVARYVVEGLLTGMR